jgi:hypothetical protein
MSRRFLHRTRTVQDTFIYHPNWCPCRHCRPYPTDRQFLCSFFLLTAVFGLMLWFGITRL